jgi:hypothetical protein
VAAGVSRVLKSAGSNGASWGSLRRVAALFAVAASTSGATTGAAVAAATHALPEPVRRGVVLVLAGGAATTLLADRGIGRLPFERFRETPRRWVDESAVAWAVKTGAVLGAGVSTRLGFPLAYVGPLTVAYCGSTWIGVFLWGLYGSCRASFSMVVARRALADPGRHARRLDGLVRSNRIWRHRTDHVALLVLGPLIAAALDW